LAQNYAGPPIAANLRKIDSRAALLKLAVRKRIAVAGLFGVGGIGRRNLAATLLEKQRRHAPGAA
jgi:hypothetical protein